jgi:cytochrome P450
MRELKLELGGPKAETDDPLPLVQWPYLEATIKEVLRLHPVFAVIGRRVRGPMRIGPFELPSGAVAAPSIYLAHRRPETWTDPGRFVPERFLGRAFSPHQYLPFGGGVRRCIGMSLALYEMRLIASEMLSGIDMELVGGSDVAERRNVTLVPSEGVPVVVVGRGSG